MRCRRDVMRDSFAKWNVLRVATQWCRTGVLRVQMEAELQIAVGPNASDRVTETPAQRVSPGAAMPNPGLCRIDNVAATPVRIGHCAMRHSFFTMPDLRVGTDARSEEFAVPSTIEQVSRNRGRSPYIRVGRTAHIQIESEKVCASAFCRILQPSDYAASFSTPTSIGGPFHRAPGRAVAFGFGIIRHSA
jgi:hypothetical protein